MLYRLAGERPFTSSECSYSPWPSLCNVFAPHCPNFPPLMFLVNLFFFLSLYSVSPLVSSLTRDKEPPPSPFFQALGPFSPLSYWSMLIFQSYAFNFPDSLVRHDLLPPFRKFSAPFFPPLARVFLKWSIVFFMVFLSSTLVLFLVASRAKDTPGTPISSTW